MKEEDPKVIQERKEAKEDISKRLISSVLEMADLTSHLEYMLIAVMGTLIFLSCIMVSLFHILGYLKILMDSQIGFAYLAGARWDVAYNDIKDEIKQGIFKQSASATAQKVAGNYDHGEL